MKIQKQVGKQVGPGPSKWSLGIPFIIIFYLMLVLGIGESWRQLSFLVIVTLCRGFKPRVWKETILTKFGTETLLFSESFNFLKLLVIFSLRLLKSYKHTRWPSHHWHFTFEVMRIFWQQAFHQKSTPLFIKFLVYTALKAGNIMKRWICIKFQFL